MGVFLMFAILRGLRRMFNGSLALAARPVAARPVARRPGLENLESRWCPAVTLGLQDGGQTLVITGDNAANILQIIQNDNANTLTVQVTGGPSQTFTSSAIKNVKINLLGGNDNLVYKLGGGSDFQFAKTIQAQMGSGDDTSAFLFAADGQSNLAEIRAALNVSVQETFGNDRTEIELGTVDDVPVNVQTRMAFGDDLVTVRLFGDLQDDAAVKLDLVDVNGILGLPQFKGGNDQYSVKAGFDVDIDENALLDIVMTTFDGNDRLDLDYEGELDGRLRAVLNAGAGTDDLKVKLEADNGSDGTVDVKLLGAAGNDKLNFQLVVDNDVAILNALADGGSGTDVGTVSPNVTKISC
jgi:hypothetical protein